MKRKKVFVFCFYGIGNIILKIPMLKAIHSMGYDIDVVSDTDCISILENESYINILNNINYNIPYKYIIMSLPNHNVGSYKRLKGEFINFSFDRLKQLRMMSKTHEVVANVNLLNKIGYKGDIPELSLTIKKNCVKSTSKHLDKNKRNIVLHNGSLGKNTSKRLPNKKFLTLICKLLQKDYNLILIGGKHEKDFKGIDTSGFTNLVGKLRLEETVALISQCDCMISSDSGPMHIASAVKTPVISYFGPTIIAKNYPWGYKEYVIKATTKCSPCYWTEHGKHCKKAKCMETIDLDKILNYTESILNDTKI